MLNKTDLSPDPPAFGIEDDRIIRVFRVSAATGADAAGLGHDLPEVGHVAFGAGDVDLDAGRAGVEELRRALFELVPEEEVVPAPEQAELVDFLVYRPEPTRRAFRVFRTETGFRVTGKPPAPEQLEAILKAAGAREGDEVQLGDDVLEWK